MKKESKGMDDMLKANVGRLDNLVCRAAAISEEFLKGGTPSIGKLIEKGAPLPKNSLII